MPSGARGGSYAPGRDRRERILDAASARFASGGYSRVSLAEIARDVGMTAPGLTHHFPSKQHLLLAIAERRFARAAQTAAEAPPDADGLGTLRLMLRQTEIRASQPELIELFVLVAGFAADPASDANVLFRARYARVVAELTARFEAAAEAGHLRDDLDYSAIAREYIAVSDGLQLQWVFSGGAVDVVGQTRAHLERIAGEILRSPQPIELFPAPIN
jgi:AcrR family transcriptional regulator